MALELTQTSDNGVVTEYHRIASLIPNYDEQKVDVVLRSYTNDSYRDTEKEQYNTEAQIASLRSQIDELLKDPNPDNEQERIDLSNQLNELTEGQSTKNDYYVVEKKVTLSVGADFDYSRASVYELLKANGYQDATDC